MTIFAVGQRIRLRQDTRQVGWDKARPAGAAATVTGMEVDATPFGDVVDYFVQFDGEASTVTLGNGHLLAEAVQ